MTIQHVTSTEAAAGTTADVRLHNNLATNIQNNRYRMTSVPGVFSDNSSFDVQGNTFVTCCNGSVVEAYNLSNQQHLFKTILHDFARASVSLLKIVEDKIFLSGVHESHPFLRVLDLKSGSITASFDDVRPFSMQWGQTKLCGTKIVCLNYDLDTLKVFDLQLSIIASIEISPKLSEDYVPWKNHLVSSDSHFVCICYRNLFTYSVENNTHNTSILSNEVSDAYLEGSKLVTLTGRNYTVRDLETQTIIAEGTINESIHNNQQITKILLCYPHLIFASNSLSILDLNSRLEVDTQTQIEEVRSLSVDSDILIIVSKNGLRFWHLPDVKLLADHPIEASSSRFLWKEGKLIENKGIAFCKDYLV